MRFSQALHRLLVTCVVFGAIDAHAARISVSTSRSFFNPSIGESLRLHISVPHRGLLSALVLDRDGVPVRSLVRTQVAPGTTVVVWDGKDAHGMVVPDEAYSFKIDLTDGPRHATYFPAARPESPVQDIRVQSYDPRAGIVAYTLPFPARVHLQAGSAVIDAQAKPQGPVLKNVVDRQPRIAGSVIEQWNGLDEGGTIMVPDQPHFVMALVASPLPENAIITVGNRTTSFLTYVVQRNQASLIHHTAAHAHHVGAQTLDDIAPALDLRVMNGSWTAAQKTWQVRSAPRLSIRLKGPAAERFLRHSKSLEVFVDGVLITRAYPTTTATTVTMPSLALGTHTIAVNWDSNVGPVAVNALRVTTPPSLAAR